jgi:polynucleotide 5'-kinase involved in rRNA processing
MRRMPVYDLERLAVGALLAFQDADGLCLALGVVEEADRPGGKVVARTPLPSLEAVASVRFGAARWDLANRRES